MPELADPGLNPSRSPGAALLLWVLIGLVVLAGTVGGLFWYWPGAFAPAAGTELPPPPDDDRVVACLGFVDAEEGLASLAPLQAGRVERVLVREGDTVSPETVLLRLDDRQQRLRVAEAEAALVGVRTQLTQARQLAQQQKGKLAHQQAALDAVAARVAAARELLARQKQLQEGRLVDAREVRVAEEQVKEAEALERAEKERLTLLKQQDPALDVQRALAEVALLEVRLQQAGQAVADCELKAPSAGTVLRLLVHPGELVGGLPNQPAVLFRPEGPLIVRAEVEQEFAHKVAVGQPALIEDDTHPETTWRGRVVRVADWYTQRRHILREPVLQQDVRTVECLIALDPGQPPPRLGLRVQVTLRKPSP